MLKNLLKTSCRCRWSRFAKIQEVNGCQYGSGCTFPTFETIKCVYKAVKLRKIVMDACSERAGVLDKPQWRSIDIYGIPLDRVTFCANTCRGFGNNLQQQSKLYTNTQFECIYTRVASGCLTIPTKSR